MVAVIGGVFLAAQLRRDQVEGHAYAIPSGRDRITVEILNGTTRAGLARAATREVRRRGLDVVFFGTADSADRTDSTLVLARRGNQGHAEIVAEALGRGRVEVRVDTLRRVDVTVVLGEDYLQ